MLRDYEILYIVRPELDEERLNEAIATVNRLIENLGGKSQKTDIWGRRRLAYEVRHLREGQYVLTDFQVEPARVPEMEATLKISETVFRHLIVRKPEPRPAPVQPAKISEDFVVQLGAFSNPANARALQRKLQENKFKAYTEVIESSGGERTRVRVGPYDSREAAEKARQRMRSLKLVLGNAPVVRQGD